MSLLFIGQVVAQTTYSVCYIHTVKSQDEQFFLKTIPFDNIEQTSSGKTTVFNSDSTKVYEINRHFELSENKQEIFLSNNGEIIVYVIDREFHWEGIQNKSIEIFNKGVSVKQFELIDLIDCDSEMEDCYLFYKESIDTVVWENKKRKTLFKENASDFEKQLTEKATFLNNDTLYIFTKTAEIVTIDLNSLRLDSLQFSAIDPNSFKEINSLQSHRRKFESPSSYSLPKLSNGLTLEQGVAKSLEMVVFPEDKKRANRFKRYSSKVQIIVDKSGNAFLDKIENYHELPEKKIRAFIASQKFVANSIPSETEKWRFSGWITLMNRSKKEAKREKQQEIIKQQEAYKNRIIADSISGYYIPKNIEECFGELNKLLKLKDIEGIKNLKSEDDLSLYHFGLGMWLRNNWGLWKGSRLQQYFFKKGIKHPDNMSGIILSYYYDWLNERYEKWKEFESK